MSLIRHREHLLAEQHMGGIHERDEAEEGTNGCEAGVPRVCPDAASALKIVEEFSDAQRREVFELEVRWLLPYAGRHESQQEAEGIAIAGDGVLAGSSLLHQANGEKRLQ
jgi:hypothetical protein